MSYNVTSPHRNALHDQGRESSKRPRGELYEQRMPGECVGLEAMLYNVHTLRVFQKILDDPLTRKPAFKHLVQYVV